MPHPRVIAKQLPVCPGKDSRFTLKRNSAQANDWWVHYQSASGDLPADQPHTQLVELVLELKRLSNSEGGSFSINEHGQVVARMSGPPGSNRDSIHAVDISGGTVSVYHQVITFQGGVLDPTSHPLEGAPWRGPLCGTTYTFSVAGKRDNLSNNYEEVRIKDTSERLSQQVTGVLSYPPATGPLADFLEALRRVLPGGGRFRINEHRRAFASDAPHLFIGIAPPHPLWFRPIPAYP